MLQKKNKTVELEIKKINLENIYRKSPGALRQYNQNRQGIHFNIKIITTSLNFIFDI